MPESGELDCMAGTIIYGLVDPRSGLLRYIGKTAQTLKRRVQQHRCDALRRAGNHKDRWLCRLYREGVPPLVVLIEAESTWEREIYWIAHYRAAGLDLLNGNDGGEGQKRTPSPETRAKMSATMKGRVRSPEHCARISEARKGFRYSAASREKMRQAHRGQKPTNIEQLRAMNTGRPIPPEQREKIRQSPLGHPVSEKTRAAVSLAHKGVKHRKKEP